MNVFNKMSNGICCFWFLLMLTRSILSIRITIGAVFENDSNFNKSSQMLQYAIDDANENILGETNLKLAAEIESIAFGREYAISRKVCSLLELGMGAIFGPKSISYAHHAINICDGKEIPYISTYIDADAANKLTVFNIHPSQDSLVLALIDVLNATGWDKVVVLYESPMWLARIMPVLETNNKFGIRFIVRDLDFNTRNDFRPIFQQLRDSDIWNIILDCSIEALPVVLKQAMQVGLLTKSYRWIITNLDTHSLDLNQFRYGATNITTFRILNNNHSIFQTKMVDPKEIPNNDEIIDSNFDDSSISDIGLTPNDIIPVYPDKFVKSMGLQESLIYDAVMIYAMTIKQLGSEYIVTMPIYCNDPSISWDKGYTITNFMKRIKYSGLTGNVEFDNFGVRSSVIIDVLELSESGLETVATWKADGLDQANRLTINHNRKLAKANALDVDNSMRNKTLKVITTLTDPYTMLKASPETKSGNDRFEGFAIDIIFELSLLLGFEYELILQEDKHYGKCINEATNEWDGMINEIMTGRADIAITDLTVTADRSKAIHFTPSILNLGIALLYRVPQKAVPKTFSFMAPLSKQIWIMLGVAYISISIVFFILGRFSPAQWENPYPCVEEPTHLHNQFSFQSAMWFAAGAILQQGSEIEVKAASLRIASAVWWFFTLIMVSSYTANLAAFLVAENTISLIKSVEDFKDCGLDGEPKCIVDFGMKQEGSTYEFFKESKYSIYRHMYQVVEKNEHLFAKDNADGLRRTQTENYAYLMESTSLLYYTERNCNVTQVGDLIDDRNYAIGMKKGYKYYHALSEGVLILQEKGIIEKLHYKWWKSKRGGGACQKKESSDAESLDIDHLMGIFVIVTYGSFCALLIGCLDAVRLIRRRARKAKISFRSELKMELRFLLTSLINPDKPKPVRFLEDHSDRSASAGTNQSHSVWATSLKNENNLMDP